MRFLTTRRKGATIVRKAGFMLLETLIALAILASIAAVTMWLDSRDFRGKQAKAQGTNLLTLSNAVGLYQTKHYTALVNGTAIPGVASAYSPTIAELKSLGLLNVGFSANNNYQGSYAIAVSRVPTGCIVPNCDLESLTNLTTAIKDPVTGRVDTVKLGEAAAAAGGNAGYSTAAAPGTINGLGGAWNRPNPAGNVAGILAIRDGYGSSGMAEFTRRDGSAPPTANWNMANVDVTGINKLGSTALNNTGAATIGGTLGVAGQTNTSGITNAGALTNTGDTAVGGKLNVTGLTTTSGITNNGALTNTGNASVGGTLGVTGKTNTNGISNTGSITNTGDISTGRLDLNTIVTSGQACPGLNGYQAATAAGSIASCINGVWSTPNATTQVPAPCTTQIVKWGSGSGCQGTAAGTASGNSVFVTSTTGTGSATYSCNAGNWAYQSGSCAVGCSGTYSWGGGKCSSTYSMQSGQQQALSYFLSGPVQAGGRYDGNATLSCNNGSISVVGNPVCTHTTDNPQVINSAVSSQQTQPTHVRLSSGQGQINSWCSAVLPGSTATGSSVDIRASSDWTCWGNNGFSCNIPWDGSVCTGANGCSCWNYANGAGNGSCWVTQKVVCTRTGP